PALLAITRSRAMPIRPSSLNLKRILSVAQIFKLSVSVELASFRDDSLCKRNRRFLFYDSALNDFAFPASRRNLPLRYSPAVSFFCPQFFCLNVFTPIFLPVPFLVAASLRCHTAAPSFRVVKGRPPAIIQRCRTAPG